MNLDEFRQATRDWLNDNCPASMRDRAVHFEDAYDVYNTDDARLWLERAAERGWTAPQWPKEYGGGGLSREEGKIFAQEMADIRALPPSADMGLTEATKQFQQEFIRRAIKRVRGNMSEAARLLGVHRSNLYRKMGQLDMSESEFE